MTPEIRQKLFNYFADNHNVQLLESDFHEIEILVKETSNNMTKQPGAKEYLIKRGIISIHSQPEDSIVFQQAELLQFMEGYAASKPYSPEVARHLLAIRDSYVCLDLKSFLKHLHRIADPTGEITKANGNVWVEMELIASEAKELKEGS